MLQEFDPNSVTIPCLRGILSEAGVCYNHVRLKAEFVVLLNSVVKPRAPKLLKTFLNVKPSDSGIMYIYTRGNSKDKPKHTRMGPNDPPDPNFKIEGKQNPSYAHSYTRVNFRPKKFHQKLTSRSTRTWQRPS
ncbi:hypothetical protein H4Q26_005181 [Puccinia striiformis f. sp. tritici PST-130]|nr:hypothetical protein H4Q26_005181 [Puccinia striiformis f. sp. tritici PST-130]